jgi:hypothetical protein
LMRVWPLATEVEPVVSFFADNFACRTHMVPLPLPPVAMLEVSTATAQALTRQTIKRRM